MYALEMQLSQMHPIQRLYDLTADNFPIFLLKNWKKVD
jgi:hypothetical protein